jgi:VWFA-related protein
VKKGRNICGWITQRLAALAVAASLCSCPIGDALWAAPSPPHQEGSAIRVASEEVVVNVTVRDKKGNIVRGFTRDDFTVFEDNKQQKILAFETEDTDATPSPAPSAGPEQATMLTTPRPGTPSATSTAPVDTKDRRVTILFFDLSSMQPEDIQQSVVSAQNFVAKQMSATDLVSVVSLGASLLVNQDFTSDRDLLKKAIGALNPAAGQGFAEGPTGTTEDTPDNANPFTPDDTEYNIFNTDRRLEAIRSLAKQLSGVNVKKSLIYFSSGMDRTGIENESELRSAINQAVRSNVAIYTVDMSGLQAFPPGGAAQNASLRGVSPYSGASTLADYNSNFTNQESLVTLASDTGGKAFLDSNDFTKVFNQVQADTSFYYVIAYQSSNPARDGRYRRINARLNRPGMKLEFRQGYYAPADFRHSTHDQREEQLDSELNSDLSATDLPVYLSTGYFRLGDNRFYVPVSVVVPGNAVPFSQSNDQDRATLDVEGAAFDSAHHPLARIRDTVKLTIPGAQQVRSKNVQYNAAFQLPPGKYRLKFVVRENETGKLGSFEATLTVPDFKQAPLKMSSIVLATQTQQATKRRTDDPMVQNGVELIPNVTHVFSSNQDLYFFYEVYDPARGRSHAASASVKSGDKGSAASAPAGQGGVRVLSNVIFFRGRVKAYETPLVVADSLNASSGTATAFRLAVPLASLQPGLYTCQVNVIDDTAGRFLFPRLAVLIKK